MNAEGNSVTSYWKHFLTMESRYEKLNLAALENFSSSFSCILRMEDLLSAGSEVLCKLSALSSVVAVVAASQILSLMLTKVLIFLLLYF